MPIQLPRNVTAQRVPISDSSFFYVLRHCELGVLGKIRVEQGPAGGFKVKPELFAPDGSSALNERRRVAFEPIVRSAIMELDDSVLPADAVL